MLSIEQAVEFIDENYGAKVDPALSTRYDHNDPQGNYVIQVSKFEVDKTVTFDWFSVNPIDGFYDSEFNNLNGRIEVAPITQWGKIAVTPVPNEPTFVEIAFDKPFNTIPAITVTANTTVPGTTVLETSVIADEAGAKLYITRTNDTRTQLHWIAVGV